MASFNIEDYIRCVGSMGKHKRGGSQSSIVFPVSSYSVSFLPAAGMCRHWYVS